MRPLLEGHPLLDGFIPLTRDRRALAEAFRACRADALVHLHPNPNAQLAGRAAAIPMRVGYRHRWWLDLLTLTDRLDDDRRAGARHEAEYNFDLLAPLHLDDLRAPPLADLRPRVHLDEAWRESLERKLRAAGFDDPTARPFVVLNPAAFSPTVRWPAARFATLAERIREALGLAVVLIAGSADDPSILEIRHRLGTRADAASGDVLDLSGQTNLAELGWLLRAARALVSRDTGPSHLASAVGCPLVQIFGRLEPIYGPGRWRALGEPDRIAVVRGRPGERRRWESPRAYWQRGFESVEVEEVLAALRRLLAASAA